MTKFKEGVWRRSRSRRKRRIRRDRLLIQKGTSIKRRPGPRSLPRARLQCDARRLTRPRLSVPQLHLWFLAKTSTTTRKTMASEAKHPTLVEDAERPTKRARLDGSVPGSESAGTGEHAKDAAGLADGDSGDEEEESVTLPTGQPEPSKASDLYLDTVCMKCPTFRGYCLSTSVDQQSCLGFRLRESVLSLVIQHQHLRLPGVRQVLPGSRTQLIRLCSCHPRRSSCLHKPRDDEGQLVVSRRPPRFSHWIRFMSSPMATLYRTLHWKI